MKRSSLFGAYPQFQQLEDREEQAPVHCSQCNIKTLTLGLFLPQTPFPGTSWLQAWLVPVKKTALSIAASTHVIFCKTKRDSVTTPHIPFSPIFPEDTP